MHTSRVCHGYTAGTISQHPTRTRRNRTRGGYGYIPTRNFRGMPRNPRYTPYPRLSSVKICHISSYIFMVKGLGPCNQATPEGGVDFDYKSKTEPPGLGFGETTCGDACKCVGWVYVRSRKSGIRAWDRGIERHTRGVGVRV
jgi:hypothetical protein